MAENELQILIKGIFSRIKEKYRYTDEQALIYLKGYEDCAEEHQQSLEKRDKMLRDTVAELCEAKRFLKAAVEDIRHCMHSYDPCEVCSLLDKDGECPATDDDDCKEKYKWRYEAEALKLIGDNN